MATLIIAVAVVAIGLFLRQQLFMLSRVEVRVEPSQVIAGEAREATVTLVPQGRLGWSIPFRTLRFRCVVEEGAQIVSVRHAADSTVAYLRSSGAPGHVELRITTDAWPWPLMAVFTVERALARWMSPTVPPAPHPFSSAGIAAWTP
jgi:hypothetical protein